MTRVHFILLSSKQSMEPQVFFHFSQSLALALNISRAILSPALYFLLKSTLSSYRWHTLYLYFHICKRRYNFFSISYNLIMGFVSVSFFYLKILKSWSISESPWKRGLFVTISAKMHPILQISVAMEYLCDPSKISGALYHRVTTWQQKEDLIELQ